MYHLAALLCLALVLQTPSGGKGAPSEKKSTTVKIHGMWRYTTNKTCEELTQQVPNSYDDVLLQECFRQLGQRAQYIQDTKIVQGDCLKTGQGNQVRYRQVFSCVGVATPAMRCFSCSSSGLNLDDLSGQYVSETCDLTAVDQCTDRQVCFTTYDYHKDISNNRRIIVKKGCMEQQDCENLKAKDLCKSGAEPSCTYCCTSPLCNHNVFVTRPPYLDVINHGDGPVCQCANGGSCNTDGTCACPPGFNGKNCEITQCSTSPCLYGGQCSSTSASPYFQCHCRPAYVGDRCQNPCPKCTPNICENGGTCYVRPGNAGTSCLCRTGYIGDRCENKSLTCHPSAKHYKASLSHQSSQHSCSSYNQYLNSQRDVQTFKVLCAMSMGTSAGFNYGSAPPVGAIGTARCEKSGGHLWTELEMCCPACYGNPCKNGGFCKPLGDGGQDYVCRCPFGYTGKHCEQRESMCYVSGDPHYHTIDGSTIHFQGNCTYLLVETLTSSGLPHFIIRQKNERRNGRIDVSYVRHIEIEVAGYVVRIGRNKQVYVNGQLRLGDFKKEFNVIDNGFTKVFKVMNNGFMRRLEVSFVNAKSGEVHTVVLQFDGQWLAQVILPPAYKSKVKGLCGNFDGDPENDFSTCDGELVNTKPNFHSLIGNSCAVEDEENKNCTGPDRDLPICSEDEFLQITDKCKHIKAAGGVFSSCDVDKAVLYESCLYDVCRSKDPKDACSNLETVAKQCEAKGQAVPGWRETTGCAKDCTAPFVYSKLTSACPETCQNRDAVKSCSLPDTENCVCPQGMLLSNDTCVQPEQCPCDMGDGKLIPVGDSVYVDSKCTEQYACDSQGNVIKKQSSCQVGQRCVQRKDGYYTCVFVPVDGGWSPWSVWTDCPDEYSDKSRISHTRDCNNPAPMYGGKDCVGPKYEEKVCDVDGQYGNWSGSCDQKTGMMTRTRLCDSPPQSGNGRDCVGPSTETVTCKVHGGWSVWGDWVCDHKTGVAKRDRYCNNPMPKNGGNPCPGENYEEEECEVHGGWSDWDDWVCDHNTGVSRRYRYCNNPEPKNGGKPCPGENYEEKECPIHGGWSDWDDWVCDHNTGVSRRYRYCNNPEPKNGGNPCPGENYEEKQCPIQVDGGWSDWGSWSDCENGQRERNRTCTQPAPAYGGADCVGQAVQHEECAMCTERQASDCDKCEKIHEVGYLEDLCSPCQGFYQCYQPGDWRIIRMECPECTCWSQELLTCVRDPNQDYCDVTPITETVTHDGSVCHRKGPGYIFSAMSVPDDVCRYQRVGQQESSLCAPYTAFSFAACNCLPVDDCEPPPHNAYCLHFHVKNNVLDWTPYYRYTMWLRDGTHVWSSDFPQIDGVGGNKGGNFMNKDVLEIPYYSNIRMKWVEVSFWFLRDSNTAGNMVLLSNGGCDQTASLLITSHENKTVSAYIRTHGNAILTTTSNQLSTGWVYVKVIYRPVLNSSTYRLTLMIQNVVHGTSEHASLRNEGDMNIFSQCAMLVGADIRGGSFVDYYTGYMDELCIDEEKGW